MEKIIIEETNAEQPFHVRFVARNGKRTFWCENFKTKQSAYKAIRRHAETFVGMGNARIVAAPLLASGQCLDLGNGQLVEIEHRDSRYKRA